MRILLVFFVATAFLLGDVFDESDWRRLEGLHVVDEEWDIVANSGREEIVAQSPQ